MLFSSKEKLNKFYSNLENLSQDELKQICADLAVYAVESFDTPNKRLPLEMRKYGCITYSDASEFRDAAVNLYNNRLK